MYISRAAMRPQRLLNAVGAESSKRYTFEGKQMNQNQLSSERANHASLPPDLSPRIIKLARTIDHLPAGEYNITLTKTPAPQEWKIEISPAAKVVIISE